MLSFLVFSFFGMFQASFFVNQMNNGEFYYTTFDHESGISKIVSVDPSGSELTTHAMFDYEINHFTYSSKSMIAAYMKDEDFYVIFLRTLIELGVFPGKKFVALSISSDGTKIACLRNGPPQQLIIFDWLSGAETLLFETESVLTFRFAPDDSILWLIHESNTVAQEMLEIKPLDRVEFRQMYEMAEREIRWCSISPRGSRILAQNNFGILILIRIESNEVIKIITDCSDIVAIGWSEDMDYAYLESANPTTESNLVIMDLKSFSLFELADKIEEIEEKEAK